MIYGKLTIRDEETGEEHQFSNLITSGGLSMLRDYLLATRPDMAPQPPLYVAYGSGVLTPGRFMTRVPGETFRTPIVSRDADGWSATYNWYVRDTDNLNQTIGMYGLYAGEATPAADTGLLFAVAAEPVPFSKLASKTYSGSWTVTISGVVA